MSLNIDMKTIRLVNFFGFSLFLDKNSWTLWQSCNVVNPGKIIPLEFHWLTDKSVQSSVFWWTFEPRQSVFPCNIWLRVLVHLTKTQNRIWEYVDLCVQETDDLFITCSRQILSWGVFPVNWTHSIDLVWLFGYLFLRYVEHLFHCEIFCIFDGMPIVWEILHHQYRCLQCRRHKHSLYHRMLSFVASFENCFCLFRTRSFTLCKNDLDFDEKSDSVTVLESISSSSITNLSVCCVNKPAGCSLTGLSVLASSTSSDFHSWEDHFSSAFHSE